MPPLGPPSDSLESHNINFLPLSHGIKPAMQNKKNLAIIIRPSITAFIEFDRAGLLPGTKKRETGLSPEVKGQDAGRIKIRERGNVDGWWVSCCWKQFQHCAPRFPQAEVRRRALIRFDTCRAC